MFKKFLFFVLVPILLFSMLGACDASTSIIKLDSQGTSHYFTVNVLRADGTHFYWERDITGISGEYLRFENNNQPYTVSVGSRAWIDKSLFNYGWSNPVAMSLYNDMSDSRYIHVSATTCGDTIWCGGHIYLRLQTDYTI